MTARRRRAALYALGALLAALFCAVLASSVDSGSRRGVLIALTVAWLIVAASCVAAVLRTAAPLPPAGPPTDEVGSDEPA
jgi:MFS-type transporter involved in bile tolerance (Atg22 family)